MKSTQDKSVSGGPKGTHGGTARSKTGTTGGSRGGSRTESSAGYPASGQRPVRSKDGHRTKRNQT